jgi:L-fuconate dehydratase
MVEYVDHLHEHFAEPVRIVAGSYMPPREPGIGARMRPESIARFTYPDGPAWTGTPTDQSRGASQEGTSR